MSGYDTDEHTDIIELYKTSSVKKWIKLIPIEKMVLIDNYNRKDYFIHVADIVLDENKKRKTLIQFEPVISKKDFAKKSEWLYLLVIDDRIVKIGGTRSGLKYRTASYLCGHHVIERGKSGDCSKTNGFIYNTFEFYLRSGSKIKMYGYELPKTEIKIVAQTYHAYESTFLEDYKKKYKEYPFLSDNCDPDYK